MCTHTLHTIHTVLYSDSKSNYPFENVKCAEHISIELKSNLLELMVYQYDSSSFRTILYHLLLFISTYFNTLLIDIPMREIYFSFGSSK